jgi:2-oxo-4-hydroxy-4-carboxy-5-ureidoimidazoline decarboxylase
MATPALETINELDEDAFAAALGSLFERSPWIVRAAWTRRPFGTIADLHAAFGAVMREAPRERQLDLIRAHPELAGREAAAGELTAESSREQASAGLKRLAPGDAAALRAANAAYREKFGFPFVVCVREHTVASIIANAQARLERTRDEEIDAALTEIGKIARLRLENLP